MLIKFPHAELACKFWLLFVVIAEFIPALHAQETVYITAKTTVEEVKTVYATPPASIPSSYTSLSRFKDTVLKVTNEYRTAHDASPLVWNDTLTEYSRKWAETCIWKHSHGPYGENLAFGYPNASAAVEAWGDERKMYDFDKPTGFTEATGHFTQLVWKTTTQVGCAAINCGTKHDRNRIRRGDEELEETQNDSERKNAITSSHLVAREPDGSTRAQGWYVVCEYTPAGNVVGRHDKYFKLNVKQGNSSSSEPSGGASMKSAMESKTFLLVLALITVAIGMSLYG